MEFPQKTATQYKSVLHFVFVQFLFLLFLLPGIRTYAAINARACV